MQFIQNNRNARPWRRSDEAWQRIGNCRRLIYFAWLALRYDSALFSAVLFNSVRDVGDGLIHRIDVLKPGGESLRIDIPLD